MFLEIHITDDKLHRIKKNLGACYIYSSVYLTAPTFKQWRGEYSVLGRDRRFQ